MAMEIARLDHVAIAADDTDAMAAWYQRVLGFKVIVARGPTPPQKQKVYLIGPAADGLAGGSMIEVMPRNDVPRHKRGSHDPGLSHIAWAVRDFDGVYAHLKAQGVRWLGEVVEAVGGGRLASFEDNEGNMLQIVERR